MCIEIKCFNLSGRPKDDFPIRHENIANHLYKGKRANFACHHLSADKRHKASFKWVEISWKSTLPAAPVGTGWMLSSAGILCLAVDCKSLIKLIDVRNGRVSCVACLQPISMSVVYPPCFSSSGFTPRPEIKDPFQLWPSTDRDPIYR